MDSNNTMHQKLFNNLKIITRYDSIDIESLDDLTVLSDFSNSDALNIVNKIIILKNNTNLNESNENSISHTFNYDDYYKNSNDNIELISFYNSSLKKLDIEENLEFVFKKDDSFKDSYLNLKKAFYGDFKEEQLNLSHVILIKKSLNLKEFIELYKLAIKTKTEFFSKKNIPIQFKEILNKDEFLAVVSSNENKETTITSKIQQTKTDKNEFNELKKEIKEITLKSCEKFFEIINIDFGILDYIYSKGITLEDLVDAGMELLVGVEHTEKIKEKLLAQILLSLRDINVIALIISAVRCEEDFMNNRIREVDVSDDPAYLYTDEVLGLAISNQIAGTKATFNFKRYDEEKPGILSKLDPMSDDIFAGLIAGCMSKIFDEH